MCTASGPHELRCIPESGGRAVVLSRKLLPKLDVLKVKPFTDEIFGPVLYLVRTASYEQEQAVNMVNEHGNGTAIFTRDGEH